MHSHSLDDHTCDVALHITRLHSVKLHLVTLTNLDHKLRSRLVLLLRTGIQSAAQLVNACAQSDDIDELQTKLCLAAGTSSLMVKVRSIGQNPRCCFDL